MEITPYSKNAKKHPDRQLKLIAESIKQFGWQQPIKVGQDNVIIVGHGRWEAYQKYGKGLKPAWIVNKDGKTISGEAETRQLTPAEEKAYRLADNKINESDWEMDKVIDELRELDKEGFDIGVTGFDYDLLLDPEDKDDEVPETPEEPKSKLGDLYELGNHRVLCGDSTKIEDVDRLMDGKKADMVFTDPPYNIGFGGSMSNTTVDGKMVKHKGANQKHEAIHNDRMDEGEFKQFILDILNTIRMYSEGAYYITFGSQTLNQLLQPMHETEMEYKSIIIWMKNQATLSGKDYKSRYEPIVYGRFNDGFYGTRYEQEDIWEIQRTLKNDLHPTMKPVPLVEKALLNSSERGMGILDLFLGSGSTLIASEKTGRICYGMELDPKYVDVIIQRYVDYTGNTAVKKNGEVEVWSITPKDD